MKKLALFLIWGLILGSPAFLEAKSVKKKAGKAKAAKPVEESGDEEAAVGGEGAGDAAGKSGKATADASVTLKEGEKLLHQFQRRLEFDPHPSLIEPLDKPLQDGKDSLVYRIETKESWNSEEGEPFLQNLGLVLTFVRNENPTIHQIEPEKLNGKKMPKDGILGEGAFGSYRIVCRLTDVAAQGQKVTGVTLETLLVGKAAAVAPESASTATASADPAAPAAPDASGETPAPTEAAGADSADEGGSAGKLVAAGGTALKIAAGILATAEALEEGKAAGKAMLLKKALGMLGDAPIGEAAEMAAKIREKLASVRVPQKPETPGAGKVTEAKPVAADAAAGKAVSPAVSEPGLGEKSPLASLPGASGAEVTAGSALGTPEARAAVQEAKRKFALGQDADARAALRTAVEKDPRCLEAWELLGNNALQNSKYQKAKEAFEAALNLKDDDDVAALGFFKACYYQGEAEIGLEKIKALAGKYPKKSSMRLSYAEALLQASDYSGCEEECRRILQDFPSSSKANDLLRRAQEKTK